MSETKKAVNKKALGIIAAIILLLIASYAVYVTFIRDDGKDVDESGLMADPLDNDAERIRNLDSQGNTNAARQLAKDELSAFNLSEEKKLVLTKALVSVEINSGNYSEAVRIVDEYPEKQLDHEMTGYGGLAYYKLGNKAEAKQYYEQTIVLLPKDDPLYEADVRYLRDIIDSQLGGA